MKTPEFKKAFDPEKIEDLKQPEKFMKSDDEIKNWNNYSDAIKQESESFEQVLYTIAVEPSLKKAIQVAGKKRGKQKGGAKSLIREAMTSYFEEHPELLG